MAHEHHHGHAHGHHHAHTDHPHNRAFAIGVALNLAFVAIEAYYGWHFNALALLADAGHNLGDVAGLLLAWGGAIAMGWKPDARHTYGWKRATILAAFLNAVLLLGAMGVLIWEAAQRLLTPTLALEGLGPTTMAVAGVGVLINTATAWLFLRGSDEDLNIRGAFAHMAADALVSLGVVVAGALTWWRGWTWLDPVVSLVIAVLILWGTWGLFRQSTHLLFDGVPANVDPHAVEAFLRDQPGVQGVHDLHIWATSTTETALTAHLLMPDGLPDDTSHDGFLVHLGQTLQSRFGIAHTTVQWTREPLLTSCRAGQHSH